MRRSEASAVLRVMGDVEGRSFIDLGAGSGYYTRIFQALGAVDIVAVDMSEEMLAEMPSAVRVHVADIMTIDLNEKFERILCAGALEFVTTPGNVFKAARSLATDDSRMVVLAPNANPLGYLYKFFHGFHGLALNLFRPDVLRQTAERAGWHVESIEKVMPFSLVASLSAR